jgi:hypothetical protein
VLRAAELLRYRDYLTVVLIINREAVFPDNWIYIHSPEVKMGRIQNYKNWSPDMTPDASRTALGLEYFLWDQDEEWRWSRERLVEQGIRECARIGLIDPREVDDGVVVRMPKAYPVYDQWYQSSVAVIRRYLENFPNLQTIGRNGLHRYNNQDHSMLTGVYAARNVVGERHDVWSVNTEMEYHEEGQTPDFKTGDRGVPVQILSPTAASSPDMVIAAVFAKLDPVALGIAVGGVCGFGLFLATLLLLLKGGPVVGPNLSLLGHYLPGFATTWPGALIGLLEGGGVGFALGYSIAWLRNWGMWAYADLVRRRAEAEAQRNLLDKV